MPETKHKPVFDEQTLAKLLEAAFVLQEHNSELQAMSQRAERQDSPSPVEPRQSVRRTENNDPGSSETAPPEGDYAPILAQIVETQHQIQSQALELDDRLALVAEHVTAIARAGGGAIGLLDRGKIHYKVVFGGMTPAVGAEISVERALCAACVRSGQVMRCEDVNLEFLLDVEECRRRGIQSMVAVPIYQVGGIAGGLEVYYDGKRGFTEHDVHTCQLMAGLVTEALACGDELAWKESPASGSSIVQAALRPDLAVLAEVSAGKGITSATTVPFVCRKCGHELVGKEQFCGKCGSPRAGGDELPSPSEVASVWHAQKASKKNARQAPGNGSSAEGQRTDIGGGLPERVLPELIEEEIQERFAVPGLRIQEATFSGKSSGAVEKAEIDNASTPTLAVTPGPVDKADTLSAGRRPLESKPVADWSSAATARAFLEQFAGQRPAAWTRFWNDRRGDVYLAIAVILVACVIRWGIWSGHSVSATGGGQSTAAAAHHTPAPEDDLSLFDRMLVKLGLAEAPEPAESNGNPEVQVWVDLKTALYYCPGTDLYGKTPKGKFTTQRDAQLDQFEPAYRKACN